MRAATLSAVGHVPVAGLARILGIDRFMSGFMSGARALTHIIGNGVATVVVARRCRSLDRTRMQQVLNEETGLEAGEPEIRLDEREAGMDMHGGRPPRALGVH